MLRHVLLYWCTVGTSKCEFSAHLQIKIDKLQFKVIQTSSQTKFLSLLANNFILKCLCLFSLIYFSLILRVYSRRHAKEKSCFRDNADASLL